MPESHGALPCGTSDSSLSPVSAVRHCLTWQVIRRSSQRGGVNLEAPKSTIVLSTGRGGRHHCRSQPIIETRRD
jgi:hypothetical protein